MKSLRRLPVLLALAGIIPMLLACHVGAVAPTSQQSIGRVELMPNLPAPFKLKDFKSVARGYEKLVFNFNPSGDCWYDAYTTLAKMPGGLNFDHTAFSLAQMKPIDNGKWHEPDGAAGIAWIEYSAYRKFGDKKYLDAAAALTSYLEARDTNPL